MRTSFSKDGVKSERAIHRVAFVLASCLCGLATSIQPGALHAQAYVDLHDVDCATDGCEPYYPGMLAQGTDGNLYGTLPQQGPPSSQGTIFRMTPSGALTVLHAFSGQDGSTPFGGLTLGKDGSLYGVTSQGGAHSIGTVFKVTSSGAFIKLHDFAGPDGTYPEGPPVQAKGGAFYGLTYQGTAYTITSSGAFSLLSTAVPLHAYAPLILASDGNFYGTSYDRGSLGYGTVFRLSPGGTVTVIYNFDSTHGANPVGPLVQGSDGNLYGTANQGGSGVEPGGLVFRLSLNGAITILHEFDCADTTDGCYPYAGLVLGTDGNLYGETTTTFGGSALYGTIFKISESGNYSQLYLFDGTHGATPYSTAIQHTNGMIYGGANAGGANDTGVLWSFNAGITPFVSIVGYPASAPGATVGILGQGFDTASSVKFGAGSATFNVVSDTYMTATVPSAGTTGAITVKTNAGTLASRQKFKVTPVLKSFTPSSGAVGTQVTISGSGFIGTTGVFFNGVKATFTVNSGTQITSTVPSGATTGKIKITTPGGTATASGVFTVD